MSIKLNIPKEVQPAAVRRGLAAAVRRVELAEMSVASARSTGRRDIIDAADLRLKRASEMASAWRTCLNEVEQAA